MRNRRRRRRRSTRGSCKVSWNALRSSLLLQKIVKMRHRLLISLLFWSRRSRNGEKQLNWSPGVARKRFLVEDNVSGDDNTSTNRIPESPARVFVRIAQKHARKRLWLQRFALIWLYMRICSASKDSESRIARFLAIPKRVGSGRALQGRSSADIMQEIRSQQCFSPECVKLRTP
jgi:hypothetical protein